MKKFFILLVILSIALTFYGCRDQESNFGVLDIEKVIQQAPKALEYQKRLDDAGREIEERFQNLEADLSEEEAMAKQKEAYHEYLLIKEELENEFNSEINQIVAEIANEKNLEVVLYKQAVRLGGLDITELVLDQLQ